MAEYPEELVSVFQQFNDRKVAAGHFSIGVTPERADETGNSHVCLRIVAVGASVYHSMQPNIGKLVFSAEQLPSGKYKLWQYFRQQSPCEPFCVGEFSTSDELRDALERTVSFM
jgi:hypothetical protein